MFKATHSFKDQSSSAHTLSFDVEDTFFILEKTNSSWWLASKNNGETGYIPCKYIKPCEKENSQDIVLQSIDRAINVVYSSSSGDLTAEQKSVLRKLQQHRQQVTASLNVKKDGNKRPAPPPPTRKTEVSSSPSIPQRSSFTKRQAPKHPSNLDKAPSSPNVDKASSSPNVDKASSSPNLDKSPSSPNSNPRTSLTHSQNTNTDSAKNSFDPKVPVQLGQELMSRIQSDCRLPELKSKEVIESLLNMIGENIPELMKIMEEIVETLPEVEVAADPHLEKLTLALANIAEIKDDGQQNNWAIEDDEMKISGILNEIMEALAVVDKADSVRELSYNDHEYLVVLAVYHQMESRVSLRLLVLQILGVICSLSNACVSALMTTVLPLELVQDVTVHTDDIQRVCYSALVLSMLFSTGEPVPLSYYGQFFFVRVKASLSAVDFADRIDENFISFLIDSIEKGLSRDADDQASDIFVRLILAINLHFVVPSDNLVMAAINECRCTTLSEKTMLLINRGDDPVRISDTDEIPNSVLKFFQDVFSRQDTSQSFLYTNDLFVLIDIIVRNLSDLPSGVKTRTDYLDLLLNVLERSNYREAKHRSSEILAILERIEAEELPLENEAMRSAADFDKTIVKRILSDRESLIQ